jgi:hypothetical protein
LAVTGQASEGKALPNVRIDGVRKSGTSSLHQYLGMGAGVASWPSASFVLFDELSTDG